MGTTDRVLIDTSAFYALLSADDRFHHQASVVYQGLIDGGRELWTTSYTLVETVALLHNRLGFDVVSEFSEWLRRSDVQVFWIDGLVHAEAWHQYAASRGRGMSFVDWTTAAVSSEMGAPVFTFDRGFANQGFSVAPR